MKNPAKPTLTTVLLFLTITSCLSQSSNKDTVTYFLYKSADDFFNGKYDKGHYVKSNKGYQLANGKEVNVIDYWGIYSSGMLNRRTPELKKKYGLDAVSLKVFVCGKICIYFGGDIVFLNNPLRISEITAHDKQPLYVSLGLNGEVVEFDDIDKITDDPEILAAVKSFKYRSAGQIGNPDKVMHGFLYERIQFAIDYNNAHPSGKTEFNLVDNIESNCVLQYIPYESYQQNKH